LHQHDLDRQAAGIGHKFASSRQSPQDITLGAHGPLWGRVARRLSSDYASRARVILAII
jgi:hypothetical protein